MPEKTQKSSAKPDNNKESGGRFVPQSVARLHAVQAIYGQAINPDLVPLVVNDYLSRRTGMDIEGETLAQPDKKLFSKIVQGVEERRDDLHGMLTAALGAEGRMPEPLLSAILFCGAYELLANLDVDAPIILNDYIEVAHAYYPAGEAKLVNAVLDKLAKNLRA